jgi:hypothetical protein
VKFIWSEFYDHRSLKGNPKIIGIDAWQGLRAISRGRKPPRPLLIHIKGFVSRLRRKIYDCLNPGESGGQSSEIVDAVIIALICTP